MRREHLKGKQLLLHGLRVGKFAPPQAVKSALSHKYEHHELNNIEQYCIVY